MKIKLVVASLSVLGLISCPALAAQHKMHHPAKPAHHVDQDSETMDSVPEAMTAPAPVIEVMPRVNPYQPMVESMTQNLGRNNVATPDWFQRIGVAGGLNVDGHWGNLSNGYAGENGRRVSVNDAYLNVTGYVNDWAKAFVAVSYNNAAYGVNSDGTQANGTNVVTPSLLGNYSNAYTYDRLNAEQAYLTLGNFDCTPIFIQVGKQFQDFGRYQIHAFTRTLSQVMSESLQTSGKIAFATNMGLNGSIYAFDNTVRKFSQGHTSAVYGAALGYDHPNDELGYDIGVGYMSNMLGVNDIAYAVRTFHVNSTPATIGSFVDRVSALNVYADVNSGPFTLGGRYTTALQTFNVLDLSNFDLSNSLAVTHGAKPWAFDVTAGYNFEAWCKSQNVYLGYQSSGDAVNIFLPKNRWMLGYGIDVLKNTTLSAEWDYDKAYSKSHGGNGNNSSLYGVRAAVKFG